MKEIDRINGVTLVFLDNLTCDLEVQYYVMHTSGRALKMFTAPLSEFPDIDSLGTWVRRQFVMDLRRALNQR